MNFTGTIQDAFQPAPPNEKGVMYQNISVLDNSGIVYNGRIGFKKGTGYAQNQPIQVTADLNDDGQTYYFRKVNPGYPKPTQQQAPPATQQPAYTQPTPPAQNQPPAQQQAPAEDPTRVSIERQNACKAACIRFQGMSDIAKNEVMDLVALLANFNKTGKTHISGNEDGLLDEEYHE